MHRLTITLDNDLYAMARAHAVAHNLSLSKAISDLLRSRQASLPISGPTSGTAISPPFTIDPDTLLPVVEGGAQPVTSEDVERAILDDDLRHLTVMSARPGTHDQTSPRQAARS